MWVGFELTYSYLLSFLLPDFKKKLKWKYCHGFSKAQWCLSAEFPVPGEDVSPDSGHTGHTLAFTQGRGILGKGSEKSWEKRKQETTFLGKAFTVHSFWILLCYSFLSRVSLPWGAHPYSASQHQNLFNAWSLIVHFDPFPDLPFG